MNQKAPQSKASVVKKPKPVSTAKTVEAYKDELMVSFISTLNILISQASAAQMGTAARILYTAKEEMVHWAVDMNFHESAKDQFINRHLYESGLLALGDFMARVSDLKDDKMKSEIIRLLGTSLMTPPQSSLTED